MLLNNDSKLLVKKFIESRNVTRLLIVIAINFSDERGMTVTLSISGNTALVKYGRKRWESYPEKL